MELLLQVLDGSTVGVVLIGFIVFVEYIRIYFTTNIELIFMSKKDENKRFFARFMVLCCLLLMINYFLSFDEASIMTTCGLFLITIIVRPIVYICIKIYDWVRKKNLFKLKKKEFLCNNDKTNTLWEKLNVCLLIVSIIFAGPLVSYLIVSRQEYNSNLITVIVSVAETFLIFIRGDGFTSLESKILINKSDDSKSFFVYKKINEEYLLCGDAPKMEDANEITTIEIRLLFTKEYFLKMKNDKNV